MRDFCHFDGFGEISGTVVDIGQNMAVDIDHFWPADE
jgi:hypothetical protein